VEPTVSLDDIVRQRYETGAYGNAHIRMHRAGWEHALATWPKPGPPPPIWSPEHALTQLLSVPIVLDDSMPLGQWQLVDNTTDDVITEGTFDA
jgi:hypothetical protein